MSFCTINTNLTLSGQFLGVKVFLLCKASLPFFERTGRFNGVGEGKGVKKNTNTGIKLHSAKKEKCKNLRLAFVLCPNL
jgi:hypothetical protein